MRQGSEGSKMKTLSRRLLALFIFVFMAQMVLGCGYLQETLIASTAPPNAAAGEIEAPHPDYSDAQATIDAGNSQLVNLSRQGSEVDLEMRQTEDASALSNQDANQRKKNELDLQSTVVSLNIAHAAATQEFIQQETKLAVEATNRSQNSADAAAQAAERANATQAAQAQAIQDILAMQTVQAGAIQAAIPLTATFAAQQRNATETVQAQELLYIQATQAVHAQMTGTAYPLTATPLAVTQAAFLMQQYGREQQSFTDQVVTPLIPIIVIATLILLTFGIAWVYRWFYPMPWPRRLHSARVNYHLSPMGVIDGIFANPSPRPKPKIHLDLRPVNPASPTAMDQVHIEVVDAGEQPVADWIAELEDRMTDAGKGPI